MSKTATTIMKVMIAAHCVRNLSIAHLFDRSRWPAMLKLAFVDSFRTVDVANTRPNFKSRCFHL